MLFEGRFPEVTDKQLNIRLGEVLARSGDWDQGRQNRLSGRRVLPVDIGSTNVGGRSTIGDVNDPRDEVDEH
jgi:hypothetical protein